MHIFGQYIDGQPLPSPVEQRPGFYEYDQWDRVIKTTRYYPSSFVQVYEYEYESDGNLESISEFVNGNPAGVRTFTGYDDKVSIFRTSKIWMFIERNYSKNNLVAADTYNNKGLPTKYNSPNFGVYRFLYETDISRSDIEYKCK